MARHQEEEHPEYVEGCFGCKISNIQLGTGDAGRPSSAKSWDKELQSYRDARSQGIQPAGTTTQAVRAALEISDKMGKAFDANTMS
jgi:hypothetical protein